MPPPVDRREDADVRRVLRVLSRRRLVIAGTVLVIGALGVGSALLQKPVYQAQATVLLQPKSSETLFDPNTGQRGDPTRAVSTEIQVLTSKPVADSVAKKLGKAPPIAVAPVGNTDVVSIKARSRSASEAAAAPNAYAAAYIEYKRDAAVEDLAAASKKIQDKITDLQTQLQAIDAQAPAKPDPAAAVQLASQRDSIAQQQTTLRSELNQLQLSSSLNSGGAHLVTPATVPTVPVAPKPLRSAVASAFIGLLFGLAAAFAVDFLDDSIKTEEDLQRVLGDIPVIGMVPAVTGWKDRSQPVVVSQTEPSSPAAEAYRGLRTSLHFAGLDRPMKVIQVTSPGPVEGKTTTVANLGVAIARTGRRVVLAGCDLRRPRIQTYFNIPNTVGFTSVLLGEVPAHAAVHRVIDEDGLYVLPSGPTPPNPSEMLGSARTDDLFLALREEADTVLVDCPPLRPVTDAALLSGRVDATVIVATARKTTRSQLRRAVEQLRQVDAKIVGAVLNGVGRDDAPRDTYTYTYSQPAVPAPTNGNGAKSRWGKAAKPGS